MGRNFKASIYPKELYQTRFYKVWSNMKTRCNNKEYKDAHRYSERGIDVCDQWNTFGGFFDEMYESYLETNADNNKLTIDRIDNNKGYSKENCRWATAREQAQNTRQVKILEHNGIKLPETEWARRIGIKRSTLNMRLRKGWDVEKALTIVTNNKERCNHR